MTIQEIRLIYDGSNGDATKALYAELAKRGAAGMVCVNLLRACKNSARAKVYRGGLRGKGSYRALAYERKAWAMLQLCDILSREAGDLGIAWGWKEDPKQEYHRWVLYVSLTEGQASFHTDRRGIGPDYPAEWDGQRDVCADRIIAFAERILRCDAITAEPTSPAVTSAAPAASPAASNAAPPSPA